MSDLTLTHTSTASGACLITCSGVLDAHTSGDLDRRIAEVTSGGNHRVAVDIQEVTYIASAGVGVFLGCVNTLREAGGDLVLIYPRHVTAKEEDTGIADGYDVLEVFNLLGLDDAIPVVRDLATAEARLKA